MASPELALVVPGVTERAWPRLLPSDPAHLLAAYGDAGAARPAITTVADNGRRLLAGLRDLVGPAAPIVVATVYDPSDGSGNAGRLSLPPWPEVLELLAELNRVLGMLAEDHQALVADVHARFLGHGWPLAIPPSRQHARPIVACGTAS
jgi:hypothetical protein